MDGIMLQGGSGHFDKAHTFSKHGAYGQSVRYKNTHLETRLNELLIENDNSEIKCGELNLVQTAANRERKTSVFVRVYRTAFEHYAVVCQNKKFCRASTYVNLKHCTVMNEGSKRIRITTNDAEGNVVIFETSPKHVNGWLGALQDKLTTCSGKRGSLSPKLSPVIPRSPVMQTLHETDEEE